MWILFFHYYQRHVSELVIASISDHSFGSWGLICNKKSRHGNDFFLYAEMAARTYVRAHSLCQEHIKMNFAALVRFSHKVSFEVTRCINGGDISQSAGKMRLYGMTPPKDTKVGNEQVHQTLLDLFNTVYNSLFVLDRTIFSGCPGRGKTPSLKVSMNIWEDCSSTFIHSELAFFSYTCPNISYFSIPFMKTSLLLFFVVSTQQVGLHSC